jgi:hypothetical protein
MCAVSYSLNIRIVVSRPIRYIHIRQWDYRVLGLCPSSGILKNTFRNLDLFPSSGEGMGSLERANNKYGLAFLTPAPGGGKLSDSRLGRFKPQKDAFDTHWVGGWVVSAVGL